MRIHIEIIDNVTSAARRFVSATLPQRRREAVESALRETLAEVIVLNPVETARSRAAWVGSLEELGGTAPANWQGPHPTQDAEGRTAGRLIRQHEPDTSSVSASNAVSYVPLLEYGTSRLSPFAMARRALWLTRERTLGRLSRLFR